MQSIFYAQEQFNDLDQVYNVRSVPAKLAAITRAEYVMKLVVVCSYKQVAMCCCPAEQSTQLGPCMYKINIKKDAQ